MTLLQVPLSQLHLFPIECIDNREATHFSIVASWLDLQCSSDVNQYSKASQVSARALNCCHAVCLCASINSCHSISHPTATSIDTKIKK